MKKIQSMYHSHPAVFILCVIVLAMTILGIGTRIVHNINLLRHTNREAMTSVALLQVKSNVAQEEIILPGNVQAWHEATLFARTNGYIDKWYADIGTIVKAGDLLATIDTPELDAQLRQAEADLKTAIANNDLAQSTAKRWIHLLKSESVSKQETDEKISDALAKAAIVISAKANRDRLHDLVNFERVTAPFDGVITSRTTDIGALISDGATNQVPLFHIVQADPLRIYVNVPQNYSSRLKPDMTVELRFSEHPDKVYSAKLLDTAQAIDPVSRTLLTQFSADNKNYEILPGGYTQVSLKFSSIKGNVILPVNTLLFRKEGLQIATLDKKNHVILKSIKIVRDFGNEVEIDDGIKPGESIIVNPPDSLINGQIVEVMAYHDKHTSETKT